jgi:hypothetical protein
MDRVEMDRRMILKTAGVGIALAFADLKADTVLGADACGNAKKFALARATFHHIGVPTQTKHEDERFLDGASATQQMGGWHGCALCSRGRRQGSTVA